MKLYKMELKKILNRKSLWVLASILIILILWQSIIEINNAQNVVVNFAQASGYRRFFDIVELFIVYATVAEVIILSPFYCEDKQIRINDLLKSTANGKLNDYIARVQVTFTVIICINLVMVLAAWILCLLCYGYSDNNLLLSEMFVSDSQVANEKMIIFIFRYLFNICCASIMLVSIIAFVSTFNKKVIYSEIITFIIVFIPAILEGYFKNGDMNLGYIIITGQPLMLITWRTLVESWSVYMWHLFLVAFLFNALICIGGKKWCFTPKK